MTSALRRDDIDCLGPCNPFEPFPPPRWAARSLAVLCFRREASVESLQQAILDAGLTPRQSRELDECIRGRFTVSFHHHHAVLLAFCLFFWCGRRRCTT